MNIKMKLFYLRLRYVDVSKFYLKAYWLKFQRALHIPLVSVPVKVNKNYSA